MKTNQKQFLTSVADVIIRNPVTKDIISVAKTLIDSSIQQEVSNKEVYGGYEHKLLYEWGFNKKLKFTFTDNVFREDYLAIQNGEGFKRELQKVCVGKEIVEVVNETVTLEHMPVAGTQIFIEDESENITKITANGQTFKLDGKKDGRVIVTYTTEKYGEVLRIKGDSFPKVFEVEVIGQIIVPKTNNDKELHIIMPEFKPNGNFNLDLKSDDVASIKIEGQALADNFGDYAKMIIVPKQKQPLGNVDALATYRPIVKLTDKDTTFKPVILGVRGDGSIYKNSIMLDDELTATVLDTGVAKINDKHEIEFVAAGNTEVTYALKDKPEVSLEINIECKKTV